MLISPTPASAGMTMERFQVSRCAKTLNRGDVATWVVSLYIEAACVSRWWPGYVVNAHHCPFSNSQLIGCRPYRGIVRVVEHTNLPVKMKAATCGLGRETLMLKAEW